MTSTERKAMQAALEPVINMLEAKHRRARDELQKALDELGETLTSLNATAAALAARVETIPNAALAARVEVDHAAIIALARQITRQDKRIERLKFDHAPTYLHPSFPDSMRRAVSRLEDELCGLCLDMRRLCNALEEA